jgi:hypothetical protein
MTAPGDIIYISVAGREVAYVVEAATPVSVPVDRTEDGKMIYGITGYTAVKVRPATAGEVERWRFGGKS